MGRKAQRKQGPPTPLPGSDAVKPKKGGKKRGSAAPTPAAGLKATTPLRQPKRPRVKAVDRVDEDSEDEALQAG